MPYYSDPAFLLLIPAILLTLFAQWRVHSAFKKGAKIKNSRGITGADVAKKILEAGGLSSIPIHKGKGKLSDHYDPIKKSVSLSPEVYSGSSISSLAVAAHEIGHALQHRDSYHFLALRTGLYPVVRFISWLAPFLIIAGFIFSSLNILYAGIIFFAASVVFTLITLPVEFNASSRAMVQIQELGLAQADESRQVKKVLNAAALTYVAAAIAAVLELLRLVLIARND